MEALFYLHENTNQFALIGLKFSDKIDCIIFWRIHE